MYVRFFKISVAEQLGACFSRVHTGDCHGFKASHCCVNPLFAERACPFLMALSGSLWLGVGNLCEKVLVIICRLYAR